MESAFHRRDSDICILYAFAKIFTYLLRSRFKIEGIHEKKTFIPFHLSFFSQTYGKPTEAKEIKRKKKHDLSYNNIKYARRLRSNALIR